MIPFGSGWLMVEFYRNPDRNRNEARIIKLDNQGRIVWETFYSDPVYSFRPRTLIQDSTGFLLGGGKGNLDYKLRDYFEQTSIVKFNTNGEFEWKFESQPGWSSAESIVSTSDGGFIIGAKRGNAVKVNPNIEVFQIEHLIFKLDQYQNVEWSRIMRDHRMHEFNNLEKLIDVGDGIVYCGHLNAEVIGFKGTVG